MLYDDNIPAAPFRAAWTCPRCGGVNAIELQRCATLGCADAPEPEPSAQERLEQVAARLSEGGALLPIDAAERMARHMELADEADLERAYRAELSGWRELRLWIDDFFGVARMRVEQLADAPSLDIARSPVRNY